MPPLKVGGRRSLLARIQSERVAVALAAHGVEAVPVVCTTQGDRDQQTSLRILGGQGVFTRAIEQALRDGRIDVAVHSAKDLPTELVEGTALVACLPREDVRDVLVSRDGGKLVGLPAGALVGTGSQRRAAQLLARRPDLRITDIRGNVDTRLRKLTEGRYDAIVLAAAGLARLGRLDAVSEYLAIDVMLPAAGQGAVALQAREGDAETIAQLQRLNHQPTVLAIRAERAALGILGLGCALPVAALAHLRGDELSIVGLVSDERGTRIIRAQRTGAASDPEALGRALGQDLLARGALAWEVEPVS